MSVVRRERKRRRCAPQECSAVATPVVLSPPTAHPHLAGPECVPAPRPSNSTPPSLWETLSVRHSLAKDAAVAFLFPGGRRREARLANLLEGASAGWLAGALPDAVGEEIRVPEDTPLAAGQQVQAFQRLLAMLGPPAQPAREAFAGAWRLLPHAFMAAHLLGLDRGVEVARGLFLQQPSALLTTLRLQRGDGAAMRRAIDLGFARTTMPLRRGVAEELEAASLVLRFDEDSSGEILELVSGRWLGLLHVFRAAHELRAQALLRQARAAVARTGALVALVASVGGDCASQDGDALRFAVRKGLDREAGARVVHTAAELGLLDVVRLAVEEGQAVNALSMASGHSPAMLAAHGGHLDVLRWLARQKADLTLQSRHGWTARDYAARRRQDAAVRLLDGPNLNLAAL